MRRSLSVQNIPLSCFDFRNHVLGFRPFAKPESVFGSVGDKVWRKWVAIGAPNPNLVSQCSIVRTVVAKNCPYSTMLSGLCRIFQTQAGFALW